jgi:hypothetical protein
LSYGLTFVASRMSSTALDKCIDCEILYPQ